MTDFVGELDAQLLAAARRLAGEHEPLGSPRRPAPLRRLLGAVVAVAAAAILVAIAVTIVPDDRERAADRVQTGPAPGDRPVGSSDRPPESNLRYAVPPIVLAVGDGPAGSLEIVGYRFSRGDLCIDFIYVGELGEREGSGCGSPSVHTQLVYSGRDHISVLGATTRDVATIRIHYRRSGRPGVAPATLARATRSDILAELRIGEPFTAYRAVLPGGATNLEAEALDSEGRTVWRDPFLVEPGGGAR